MPTLSKLNILDLRYENSLLTRINWFDLTPPPLFSLPQFRTRSPAESKPVVFSMHNIP